MNFVLIKWYYQIIIKSVHKKNFILSTPATLNKNQGIEINTQDIFTHCFLCLLQMKFYMINSFNYTMKQRMQFPLFGVL